MGSDITPLAEADFQSTWALSSAGPRGRKRPRNNRADMAAWHAWRFNGLLNTFTDVTLLSATEVLKVIDAASSSGDL